MYFFLLIIGMVFYIVNLFIMFVELLIDIVVCKFVGVCFFDFLGLGYWVDWLISMILICDVLKVYVDVFSFFV